MAAEELSASPMCRNAMYVHDTGGIPLTKANSNFHRKFVEWAAVEFEWPGHEFEELYAVNKVLNEPDFPRLLDMHSLLMGTRLMRHYKGKAVVTRVGEEVIGQHGELQALLVDAMMVSPFVKIVPGSISVSVETVGTVH